MSRLWWVFCILFKYNLKLSYFEGHKRRRVRRGKDAGSQIKNIKKFSNTRLSCSARWLYDIFSHKITFHIIIVSGAILHQHYTGQWMEESSKTHPLQKLSQKSKSWLFYFLSNIITFFSVYPSFYGSLFWSWNRLSQADLWSFNAMPSIILAMQLK